MATPPTPNWTSIPLTEEWSYNTDTPSGLYLLADGDTVHVQLYAEKVESIITLWDTGATLAILPAWAKPDVPGGRGAVTLGAAVLTGVSADQGECVAQVEVTAAGELVIRSGGSTGPYFHADMTAQVGGSYRRIVQ